MTEHTQNPTRRDLLALAGAGITLASSSPVWAFGDTSRLAIAIIEHGGNWNPRPNGLRKILQEVEKRTSIAIDPVARSVNPTAKDQLFRHPLLVWSGDGGFPALSNRSRENLSLFCRAGGMILVDSAQAEVGGAFEQSVKRELRAIFPGRRLRTIPKSHVLYKSFYLIPEPLGRVAVSRKMEAIFGDDRAFVLFSHNDLLGAWSRDNFGEYEFDVFPGGERQREISYRLGINIVMYAMCLNYKEDQVHVPFILRRRKWKVD
jgi:hypothetical protein